MNHLAVLTHAMANLGRWRGRTLLLVLAFAAVSALLGAYLLLRDALIGHADRVRATMPDLVVSEMTAGRPRTLPLEHAERLRDIPSVGTLTPRVWGYLFAPAIQGNLLVVGTANAAAQPLASALAQGRDLERAGEVVLGAHAAKALSTHAGARVKVPTPYTDTETTELEVVGVLTAEHDRFAADVLLVHDATARLLLGIATHEATDFAVTVKNPAERAVIARTVGQRLPGARVVDRESLGRLYAVAYGWRSGLATVCLAPALLALFLLAGERLAAIGGRERREIALLKALGYSTREVIWLRTLEAALAGLWGVTLGWLLAYLWVFVAGAAGLRAALFGFSASRALVLEPNTPFSSIVAMTLAVLAPYLGLAVFAAWRAAVVDPMNVLRG